MGCHSLLQGIFSTQNQNLHLLHWQADSLLTSHQGSPLNGKMLNMPDSILMLTWQERGHHCPHIPEEENEAQRFSDACTQNQVAQWSGSTCQCRRGKGGGFRKIPLEGGRATHSSIQRRIQYSEYAIFREVLRGVSSIWREPERLHEVTKNQTQLE